MKNLSSTLASSVREGRATEILRSLRLPKNDIRVGRLLALLQQLLNCAGEPISGFDRSLLSDRFGLRLVFRA